MITRFLTRLRYYRLVLRLARQIGTGNSRGILATGEKILELQPEEPLALSTMADAYAAQGEEGRALALRLRALEQDPQSFSLLQQTAHSYLDRGDPDRAYPLIHRALANVPTPWALPGRLERFVTYLVAWSRGRSGVAAAARDRERRRERLEAEREWIAWAERFVAWYEEERPTP